MSQFPIVIAKFWWLRSAEGYHPSKTPSLLSDTLVHNELMRRCLLRWQSETLDLGFNPLRHLLLGVASNEGFPRHLQNSLWKKV